MARSSKVPRTYKLGDTVHCLFTLAFESGAEYNLSGYIVKIGRMYCSYCAQTDVMYLISTNKDSETGHPHHFDEIEPCPEKMVGLVLSKKHKSLSRYCVPTSSLVPFDNQ
jgi:hypothetical protein